MRRKHAVGRGGASPAKGSKQGQGGASQADIFVMPQIQAAIESHLYDAPIKAKPVRCV
jgi:hypothetical protein